MFDHVVEVCHLFLAHPIDLFLFLKIEVSVHLLKELSIDL
jgi:hypothetical protein